MTYSAKDMAAELERTLIGGYYPTKVASVAFKIYQDHGLEISGRLDRDLLVLMAMAEGPEFEMTEAEFIDMLADIRRCGE
jgi:hypothetical protein